jgi:endo-1,4-beta-xylanase
MLLTNYHSPSLLPSLIAVMMLSVMIGPLGSAAHSQMPPQPESLKAFTPPNFFIGGVLHHDDSFTSPGCRGVAQREFNAITATAYLPYNVWPDPNQGINTGGFTQVADWGIRNGMKIHGHVLVYPHINKDAQWWRRLPNHEVEPALFRYVDTFARSRAGNVWCWDVVNEVIAEDNQPMDALGLRTDFKEYQAMGPSYVEKAFRWAKAADPNALLILNEAGADVWNNKSTRMFEFVKYLRRRGVPIDGVGFQYHFVDVTQPNPDIESLRRNLQRFADAGFKIFITEADVASIRTKAPGPHHPGVSTPNDQQRERQKRFFEQTLRIALEQPAVKAYLFWDFVDDYSWLHKTDRKIYNIQPGTYTHPTPFWCGKECPISPKRSYFGMLDALKTTPHAIRAD